METLKPTELRIGNLFHFGVYAVTIQSIHQVTMKNAANGKRDWHVYVSGFIDADPHYCIDGYKIEPIPITVEWLKKFRFIDDNRFANLQYRIDGEKFHSLNIYKAGNFWCPIIRCEAQKQVFEFYGIEFVHELQNLYFALTKSELVLAVAGSDLKPNSSGGILP